MDRQAVSLLRELGYRDVRAYPEGLAGWAARGAPVETGAGRTTRAPGAGATRHDGMRDRVLDLFQRIIDLPAGGLLGLWLGIIAVFGVLYWLPTLFGGVTLEAGGEPVGPSVGGLATAIYFSFVTGLSVGYGDVVPVGWARVLAIAEGGADLLLFGFVISKLMSRRQDRVLEELHHTAFEERLGRVRTNLHLTLSEFEAVAEACRAHAYGGGRLAARAESAVLVFGGELRTIHDLLYRPQRAPEEAVLEGLLGTLAANLESLRDLLDCMPQEQGPTPALRAQLGAVARLAAEICGECVPREYAPRLKHRMDRVQELARALPA